IRKHTGKHYQIKSPVNIVLLADLKSRSILRASASPTKTHEAKLSESLIKEIHENTLTIKEYQKRQLAKLEKQTIY
ncbi:MAG: hypothetical protein ACTSYR_00110, partial [Candidatus Odinarchaeia archaeon]